MSEFQNKVKAHCAWCGELKECTWQDTTDGSIELYCNKCLQDFGWNTSEKERLP